MLAFYWLEIGHKTTVFKLTSYCQSTGSKVCGEAITREDDLSPSSRYIDDGCGDSRQ